MKLIKVCLSPNKPFWFWNGIHLTPKSPVSGFFDIDKLDRETLEILNRSIKRYEIKAFDNEKHQLTSLELHNLLGGNFPEEFIEEEVVIDESNIPEIISITCATEEEKEEISPTEEDYIEAKMLLSKNGNTVRKVIFELAVNKNTIGLIKACSIIEEENKNRKSIIGMIYNKLKDYNED